MTKVLIIEDSPLIVQILTMVCEGAGHQVATGERFAEVSSLLARTRPDIIITDLNLPDLKGQDTLEALRELEGAAQLPVIIISGRPQDELEALADKHGAQGALSKDGGLPFISANLPPLIERVLAD